MILWGWTAILSGFVLVPLYFPRGNTFIPLGAAVLVLTLYTWFHPGLRKPDPLLDEPDGEAQLEGAALQEGRAWPESGPRGEPAHIETVSPGSSFKAPATSDLTEVSTEVSAEGLATAPAGAIGESTGDQMRPSRRGSHKTVLTATDAAQAPASTVRSERFVGGGQKAPPERTISLQGEPGS